MSKPRARSRKPAVEIAVVGEIFDENEKEIVQSLLDARTGEAITLYIDSSGGNVYAALAIANILRHRRLRATGVVVGECSSSAVLIFAACKARLVGPHSVFLFHRIKWRTEKDARSEEAAQWASHFQWLEQQVDEMQARWLGIPLEVMKSWIAEGRFVIGRDLVELGAAQMLEL